jgi:hypothetical protein
MSIHHNLRGYAQTDKERELIGELRFAISLLKQGDYNDADLEELAVKLRQFVADTQFTGFDASVSASTDSGEPQEGA